MAGFLFSDMVFGPVNSRRLGVSLGIKLLPTEYVMIYAIDRETPAENIRKLSFRELNEIADKVELAGFRTKVFG